MINLNGVPPSPFSYFDFTIRAVYLLTRRRGVRSVEILSSGLKYIPGSIHCLGRIIFFASFCCLIVFATRQKLLLKICHVIYQKLRQRLRNFLTYVSPL